MTITLSLPQSPGTPYVKPTLANTKGGKSYRPTHPDLFKVVFEALDTSSGDAEGKKDEEESFSSKLIAVQDFAPNSIISPLTNLSIAPAKAYSSVQYGAGAHEHFELNSDLLFMNHSCSPTAYVQLPTSTQSQWLVRASPAGIKAGQDITFFYPSTEWDMAQGFDCGCGSDKCLGRIQGAKYLTIEQLEERGYVNDHIRDLKKSQEQEK